MWCVSRLYTKCRIWGQFEASVICSLLRDFPNILFLLSMNYGLFICFKMAEKVKRNCSSGSKPWAVVRENDQNPGTWYSSESTQRELSNEYQHDRVSMTFKNHCILVLWTKGAATLELWKYRNLGYHLFRFLFGCLWVDCSMPGAGIQKLEIFTVVVINVWLFVYAFPLKWIVVKLE